MKRTLIHMKGFANLLLLAFLFPSFALGITGNFEVNTLVGDDTTPPSIPTNLVATPIATTQIDLDWDDSTDDFMVQGYHVWRDDVLVATTTNSDYQDTGLTPATSYAYYVTAFDTFFNFSASSSVATGTTLSVPPAPPPTATTSRIFGSRITPFEVQIVRIEIFPGKDSVIIRYETDDHIQGVVKWGKSTSYELGSVGESAYSKEHETVITGLTPGQTYQFTIEGLNKLERHGVLYTGTFSTLPAEDIFPPGNITGFTATIEGNDVVLSWNNPDDIDFGKVRIVRSDRFYPLDEMDGWVVYESDGEGTKDKGAAEKDGRLYYTAFAYDEAGNVSSGAVVSIFVGEGEEVGAIPDHNPAENEIALRFDDLIFTQEGNVILSKNGEVRIQGGKKLTISIPYDMLPEHLKTILVSVREGEGSDKVLKFLLRANKEKTFYEATLAPLGVRGSFPVQVSVFDFKTSQVGYTDGVIVSEIRSVPAPSLGFIDSLFPFDLDYLYTWWFILLLVLLMFFTHRLLARQW